MNKALLSAVCAAYACFAAPIAQTADLAMFISDVPAVCTDPSLFPKHWKVEHVKDGLTLTKKNTKSPNNVFFVMDGSWTEMQDALAKSLTTPDGQHTCETVLKNEISRAYRSSASPPAPTYAVVRVFYGTDRNAIPSAPPLKFSYGPDRGAVTYGECEVSIPRDHRMGQLEAPSLLRLEFREDPEKHIVLLSVNKELGADFFSVMKARIAKSASKSAFVFIHGYNVSFADAARRTAQMTYDLGFDGAPIFFTWPSAAEMAEYPKDETNVDWATPHLKQFLTDVLHNSEVESLYLIAHSMGNRALVGAFQQIVRDEPSVRTKIREVILAAPDIDADVFKNQIVPSMVGLGSSTTHVTLYASSGDLALAASKKFHGYPRAGDGGNIVVAPGLESIDASAVDTSLIGHSYYADNRSILADIYYLVRDHVRACNRFGERAQQSAVGTYCILQP